MQERLIIMSSFSAIGAVIIAIFGIVSLPISLILALVALLVLCFYKVPTTTRDNDNSHESAASGQNRDTYQYSDYPNVEATCNGDYVEAEIIDDGKSAYRWCRK